MIPVISGIIFITCFIHDIFHADIHDIPYAVIRGHA